MKLRLPKKKHDGYYAVATNLTDPAKDILAVSHNRRRIEDCFLICYTALLLYRLIEVKLDEQNTHVTINDFITTLKNMNVTNIHDIEYMALYDVSSALDA